MRYICTNCNYIYDESVWDIEEWISGLTEFYSLWDTFVCPVCWDNKDSFYEIEEEVNYISKQSYIDSLSDEHFPKIKVSDDKIVISVWKDLHPMWDEHRISSVLLYDEYWDLIEEIFLQIDEDPIVEFEYQGFDGFEIRVRCTLHWLWGRKIN